jgi:uncharacterized membrane protein
MQRLRPSGFYLEGLWYPIVIAAVSFVVGMVYIKIKIKTLTNKNTAMNQIKRLLGLVWIALAVATAYYCIDIFGGKLTSGKQEDLVFGIIIFSYCYRLWFCRHFWFTSP